jgi:alpha-amylase
VYYGQEVFLAGGNDPRNREALWDYGYNGNNLIKTLNKIRSLAILADRKYVTTLAKYLYHDDVQLFYQKGSILVGLNGNGAERKIAPYVMLIHGTTYADGEPLIEVLGCESTTAKAASQVMARMKNGAPVVFYPKKHLVGSGICGM